MLEPLPPSISETETLVSEKRKKKLSKQILDVFRTTQRNNIDLTAIADNKANVLLSVNAVIIAFLVPLVFANMDLVVLHQLYIPLIILSVTSFITIYMSVQVLQPSNFDSYKEEIKGLMRVSPFFFGNFYKMKPEEFFNYLEESLVEPELLQKHLAQDLYFVGKRLGNKMAYMRTAFRCFLIGVFLTLVSIPIILMV